MRVVIIVGMTVFLTACAGKPPPTFMNSAFQASTASKIVILPLVDQRPDHERADDPDAMKRFADNLASSRLFSSRTTLERLLERHGFSVVKNADDRDLLYLQISLTSYKTIPAISYSAGCAAEIRQGDPSGQVVWKNNAAGEVAISIGSMGPLLVLAMKDLAFESCFINLFNSLPDRNG